jgi:hypothetical protein
MRATRTRLIALALAGLLLIMQGLGSVPAHADHCLLRPEFSALRAAVGAHVVGECVGEARIATSGDVHQRTSRGELVLRTADGRAAFTNGGDTWVIGPNGLRRRPNTEQFFWETVDPAPGTARVLSATGPAAQSGAILPGRRIVSYYGNPLSSQMGILGELPTEEMLARLREQGAAYAAADPSHPVQLALELVATVAQADAGRDGMYRLRMDTELIEELSDLAERNGMLLILDVQVGRSTVAEEVGAMLKFLRKPHVHLALDPEFAMTATQKPGEVIGSHSGEDVNVAIDLVADLVSKENLPPKLLLVHRFTHNMLTDGDKIKRDPRVQVVVVMDGFGPPAVKLGTYEEVIYGKNFEYNGFKLFY